LTPRANTSLQIVSRGGIVRVRHSSQEGDVLGQPLVIREGRKVRLSLCLEDFTLFSERWVLHLPDRKAYSVEYALRLLVKADTAEQDQIARQLIGRVRRRSETIRPEPAHVVWGLPP
jgi:hypothetical protein